MILTEHGSSILTPKRVWEEGNAKVCGTLRQSK